MKQNRTFIEDVIVRALSGFGAGIITFFVLLVPVEILISMRDLSHDVFFPIIGSSAVVAMSLGTISFRLFVRVAACIGIPAAGILAGGLFAVIAGLVAALFVLIVRVAAGTPIDSSIFQNPIVWLVAVPAGLLGLVGGCGAAWEKVSELLALPERSGTLESGTTPQIAHVGSNGSAFQVIAAVVIVPLVGALFTGGAANFPAYLEKQFSAFAGAMLGLLGFATLQLILAISVASIAIIVRRGGRRETPK